MLRRYHVSGAMPVFGNPPGTEFDREIPAEQEARLLTAGALRTIDATTNSPATKKRQPKERTAARPAPATTDAHDTAATGAGADRED